MDSNKLREIWTGLTVQQRVRLGAALVATVAVIWGVSAYTTRIRYGVIYSNLEPAQANEIVAELAEQQIPYRLTAGGTVIEVPTGRIDDIRLAMSGKQLPTGGEVGFEIFDEPSFGSSSFDQTVKYQRALQRELGRTIQKIAAIDTARVHLALPEESVFADEETEATASVFVGLRGGSLPANQVRAIAHLVASGVEGLDPRNVSVVSNDGRMLSDPPDAEGGMSSTQLDARRARERSIETTLLAMLEPLVGQGRVRARATVELNLKRVTREEETYDPNSVVVLSEEKDKSSQTGPGGPGGVPGTTSNLPGGAGGAVATAGSSQQSQKTTTNFGVSRTKSMISEPVGSLVRQSVAVIVDHALVAPETEGEGGAAAAPVPTPRTEEEMEQIRKIVRTAIGFNEERGDQMSVTNAPFDETAFRPETEVGGFGLDSALRILRYLSAPLAVLLLALLVIRPGFSTLRTLSQPKPEVDKPLPTVAHLQEALRAGTVGQIAGEAPPLRRRLMEAASEDPRAAALVVRGWLTDGTD